MLLMRTIQQQKEPSETPTRISNPRNDSEFPTPLQTSSAKKKNTTVAQHENILKVSNREFRGAERVGIRWVERGGKSLA